jgi:excisionase family DNA binding protein
MATHTIRASLDPARPGIRSAARRLAAHLDDNTEVGDAVRSMLDDVAHGARVVVLRTDDEVTPAKAAEMIGVTRQYVDRLCEDGALAFRRLPGSTHRRIRVQDVLDVVGEREARRTGGDALRAAIADAGLDEE